MTDREITDLIDEQFRSDVDWCGFLDYPTHFAADEPIQTAIDISRRIDRLGKIGQGMLASAIVGAMLAAYKAGMETERMAVEYSL